jgi:hypothetical protein
MIESRMIENYRGRSFGDERHRAEPQAIPGKIMCAYYDLGGEGVAYHDRDPENHGSGGLNPLDGSYLHGFRHTEGVDTSYVKFRDQIDDNPFNLVEPEKDTLYVGWTVPGEWLRYTVQVKYSAAYRVELFYTSRRGGKISLDVDENKGDPRDIASTFRSEDPLEWRQWHHWNKTMLGEFFLREGIRVLTLNTVETGDMNYAWLDFIRAEGV